MLNLWCYNKLHFLQNIDKYFLNTHKGSRLGQRHGLQSLTLAPCFYNNIYQKVVYVYFYESIFQDKSIYMVFIFSNSIT
jgi:hypothetical protein